MKDGVQNNTGSHSLSMDKQTMRLYHGELIREGKQQMKFNMNKKKNPQNTQNTSDACYQNTEASKHL